MQTPPAQPLLKVGDELQIEGSNSTVTVEKVTSAFAYLSDFHKVRQAPRQSGTTWVYEQFILRGESKGVYGIRTMQNRRFYILLTPEFRAEKARIAAEKRAQRIAEIMQKSKELLEALDGDKLMPTQIEKMYEIAFPKSK